MSMAHSTNFSNGHNTALQEAFGQRRVKIHLYRHTARHQAGKYYIVITCYKAYRRDDSGQIIDT